MRISILAFFFLVLFQANLSAQNVPVLSKKLSIKIENETLKSALSVIEEQGKFTFSYNGALLSVDSLVSFNFINLPVCDILDQLFKSNIDYYEIDGFVILRPAIYRFFIEADEIDARERKYFIKGKVLDSRTGLGVRHVSVYERRLLKSTLTDKNGVFKMTFKGEHKSAILMASKEMYRDTTMFFLSDIKVRPEGVGEDKDKQTSFGYFGFNNIVEQTGFGRFLISSKRRIQSLNISEFFVDNRVQASFLPGLGSQGFMSSQVVNTFSFNILGGYSAGVQGFESAGLFNLTKTDINAGFQLAGLLNQVGGNVSGMQTAGLLNLVHGDFNGFQMAGLVNQVKQKFNGVQVSGIFNQTNENFYGVQFTGIANYAKEDVTGVQLSGIINTIKSDFSGIQFTGIVNKVSGEHAKGLQIAGIANISQNFKGLQFGIVNIADSISGVGIGLVNIYKNGYKKISIYTNELLSQQLSFRSGNRKLYSIIEIGTNWKNHESRMYNLGFGFGHDFILNSKMLLNAELQGLTFFNKDFKVLGNSNKLTLGAEREIFQNVGLVTGISYQLYSADSADNEGKPYPSWANKIGKSQKSWFGGKLGVVYSL